MTEIMRMLPKDLQREVWSFIGMESLGISPTAEILKDYIEDMYYHCNIIPEGEYDEDDTHLTHYDYFDKIVIYDWRNDENISRMYFLFKHVFKSNKDLFKGYKHIETKEGDYLAVWLNEPKCDYCSYDLTLKQYQNIINDEDGDLDNYCDNCYGINNGIIGDEDEVDEYCENCDKMLIGIEWKHIMNKSSEFAGMCERCIEVAEVGDSESEEEYSSEEEEEEDEEEE